MIITVTLTPALDKTVVLPFFAVNKVNRVESLRLDAGGKGINVSKVACALGIDSLATGILGGGTGEFIRRSLDEMHIPNDFVFVEQDTRTNLKIIDPEERTNTDVNEPGAKVSADVLEQVLEKALRRARVNDIVVLAGKAPPGAPDSLFADWITRLKAKGIQVFLDADAELLTHGAAALPALIKPNDEELARLTGRRLNGMIDIVKAARDLSDSGIQTVAVSLGGEGAVFVRGRRVLRGHGLKVPVQSTVGAGDAMMAAFCCGAAQNEDFETTCRRAIAVSAAAVMLPGTQAPDKAAVDALIPQVRIEPIND